MQIMALFVLSRIRELQNILIHVQLLVYSPVLFISPLVQLPPQRPIYLVAGNAAPGDRRQAAASETRRFVFDYDCMFLQPRVLQGVKVIFH